MDPGPYGRGLCGASCANGYYASGNTFAICGATLGSWVYSGACKPVQWMNQHHDGLTNPCNRNFPDYCCNHRCQYCGPRDYCHMASPFLNNLHVCNATLDGPLCFVLCSRISDSRLRCKRIVEPRGRLRRYANRA